MEKPNIALDALKQRREALQALLIRQRQCKRARLCSEENSDVIESSNTETSIKLLKTPLKTSKMCPETPIKYVTQHYGTPTKRQRRSSSKENSYMIQKTNTNIPIKLLKTPTKETKMCPEAPIKCVIKQLESPTKRLSRSCSKEMSDVIESSDVIENSFTETPIKRPTIPFRELKTPIKTSTMCFKSPIKCVTKQLVTPTKMPNIINSSNSIIFATSSMSLPLSTHYYGSNQNTPANSPFKILPPVKNNEKTQHLIAATRLSTDDIIQTSSCSSGAPNGKAICRSLIVTKPENLTMTITNAITSNAPAFNIEDTYRLPPESGLEVNLIAPSSSDCSIATNVRSKLTHLQHYETSQITDTSISSENNVYKPVDISPDLYDEKTHRSFADSRPNNADVVATSSCAAPIFIFEYPQLAPRDTEVNISTKDTVSQPVEISPDNYNEATTSSNAGITKSQKRRQRRLAAAKLKKSYMDFLSDEEQQDFSAGSSDNWDCNDSDLSTDDDSITNKKKKHVKVIKVNEENVKIKKKQNRVNFKKQNKEQKNMGQQYFTNKGKVIDSKSMKVNPCVIEKCKRGCYNITEEKRSSIFKFYWSLDIQRRRDWLIRSTEVKPVKRKRIDSNKRNITYEYYINDNVGHRKVCQKFLLDTLDITQRHLLYTLTNKQEGMSKPDMRKRSILGKYSESSKAYVCKFIEKLPACPSHYNRKKSKRLYLPQHFKNLTNLFRIYLEDCKINNAETVSEHLFRSIFHNQYDIGIHTPKKDKCALCVKAENFGDELTENDREKLKIHLEEKVAAYSRFKAHQTLKDIDTVTCSFDLQKVLNTPFGESMLLYYARKYAVFDFTVYESGTQNVFCYTWGECDGKRGSVEIASCLYLYLKELDKKGVKNAILYCDSCTGQNKNKVVLSVLNYFLLNSKNLQIIQINYLLPGHTYMPVDSVHATIEAEVKKIIVWAPSQWASYFESARKKPRPYNVTVMEHTDFMDWQELATKTFTAETSKNVKFKDIRVATFKKKKLDQMEIKYSMKEETTSQTVELFKKKEGKGKGRKVKGKGKGNKKEENTDYEEALKAINVLPIYLAKLPISACKFKDLHKLCEDGVVPKRFKKEFIEMPYDGRLQDTLIETDDEDVNESDNETV